MVLLILLAAAFLAGCGMVDSYGEREQRYKNITDMQLRMAVDDWDYFWLAERPSYLSYWYLREAD
ncbi:MAG: hypothetical protein AMJ81_05545 [Phycisphaerae bacterium SM23_33]|nr:MAG: hypothetical protein AMJ81_05545 [Phycisphaerae bacterium SM23_33]